jgi:hypothetical protein
MARGFESKDVEFQQSEASRPRPGRRNLTPAERELAGKRQGIELALAKVRAERISATNAAHQKVLDQAIHDLEEQVTKLS